MKKKMILIGALCFAAGIAVDHLIDYAKTQSYMKEFEDAEDNQEEEDFFDDDFDDFDKDEHQKNEFEEDTNKNEEHQPLE